MKNIIFAALSIIAFASFAMAAPVMTGQVPFNVVTGASGAVATSSVYNTAGSKMKTMQVTGINATDNATFKNMSGTVVAQCGSTATGPWVTSIANDYGQTAVSRTTSGIFTWTDVCQYVRLQWTAGTVSTKLKAWLFYSE